MTGFIIPRIRFPINPQRFGGWVKSFPRQYTKDTKDKDDDDKVLETEERLKVRKGILHDKQQSLQEESYFHKEEAEKLRDLKKKIISKKEEKEEKKEEDSKPPLGN